MQQKKTNNRLEIRQELEKKISEELGVKIKQVKERDISPEVQECLKGKVLDGLESEYRSGRLKNDYRPVTKRSFVEICDGCETTYRT